MAGEPSPGGERQETEDHAGTNPGSGVVGRGIGAEVVSVEGIGGEGPGSEVIGAEVTGAEGRVLDGPSLESGGAEGRVLDGPSLESGGSEEQLREVIAQYSSKVIQIWQTRRNHGALHLPDGRGGAESGCGDRIEIHLRARDGRVLDASFVSEGCGATFAVGSAAAELARGRTVQGLLAVTAREVLSELDGLPEPNRHCADMAVSALRQAAQDLLTTSKEPWKKLYRQ